MSAVPPFLIADQEIPAGTRRRVEIPLPGAFGRNQLNLPVVVIHGRQPGPKLFVCAALHGDEVVGTEVIRRLLRMRALSRLRGTLVAVPMVNFYGFVYQSRYLPDRRDLNRSFPGSEHGSIAARLANIFLTEVACRCTHGVDLHTGAVGRENLPQVRACLDHGPSKDLAMAFGAPVILGSGIIDGSLRAAMHERGTPYIVYEGGEALRMDEGAVRAGLRGVQGVIAHLGMLPPSKRSRRWVKPVTANRSAWLRATMSGLVHARAGLGAWVRAGDVLATVHDPADGASDSVLADRDGIVIGRQIQPLVNEGDAMFHVGEFHDTDTAAERVGAFDERMQAEIDASADMPPLTTDDRAAPDPPPGA